VTSATGDPLALVVGSAGSPTDPDLFAAATAAFGLSLENARLLEAADRQLIDLRAATEQALTANRAATAAAQAARSRIEQDLHDGAQMRFLALAPLIGAAQASTADPATSAALAEIKTELQSALGELRRLAHGTNAAGGASAGGLAAAVRGLAAACPLPVTVDLPHRLLPATVEGAAYLVICEALANAIKHSGATRVAIEGRVTAGRLMVSVADDGRGGAAPGGGRGLAGMTDRATAAGGRLTVSGPPGGGATVTLDLPCG
jgi:signal transduction histidine kinase